MEYSCPELLQYLEKLHTNNICTAKQALSMEDSHKAFLVQNDPISCDRYFNHKVWKFPNFLKQKNCLFGKYQVEDTFEKVEFQARGSAHEHIFLWLKDAPTYVPHSNNESLIEFIDNFLTCENNKCIPFITYLQHKHTHTCYKGRRKRKFCRFNFSLPVMPRTVILEPFPKEDDLADVKQNFSNIRSLHEKFFRQEQDVSFETILSELGISEHDYILAIRSYIKRPQIFLKRGSLDVSINSYNIDILSLFESNIDIQFVLDEFDAANYVINYIC